MRPKKERGRGRGAEREEQGQMIAFFLVLCSSAQSLRESCDGDSVRYYQQRGKQERKKERKEGRITKVKKSSKKNINEEREREMKER
jgi:hypothetical protein